MADSERERMVLCHHVGQREKRSRRAKNNFESRICIYSESILGKKKGEFESLEKLSSFVRTKKCIRDGGLKSWK